MSRSFLGNPKFQLFCDAEGMQYCVHTGYYRNDFVFVVNYCTENYVSLTSNSCSHFLVFAEEGTFDVSSSLFLSRTLVFSKMSNFIFRSIICGNDFVLLFFSVRWLELVFLSIFNMSNWPEYNTWIWFQHSIRFFGTAHTKKNDN